MVLTTAANAGTFIANWGWGPGAGVEVNGVGESAGKFTATRTGGTDILLPGPTVTTFCAELSEYIYVNGSSQTHSNVEILNGSGSQYTIAGGVQFTMQRTLRLEKLWGLGASLATATDAAAFQLAQWNILFDTDLSMGSGAFKTTGGSIGSAEEAAADNLLNGLDGKTTLATVYLLSGAGIQDQITGSTDPGGPPPGTTPEPFTMSLGLASAGLFIRRRLKAKKA